MAQSQFFTEQIRDEAITNAKIAAGAAIVTTKLADGADFLKRTGAVALTGNLPAGNFKITGLGTPTPGSNDSARIIDVETAISGLTSAFKYRTVRVSMASNVNISNPGATAFDGVTLTANDQLLGSIGLFGQTAPAENGLYLFTGSGTAMTRLSNSDTWNEFPGSLVFVNEGTVRGNTRWTCTSDDGGTLGTTAITYVQDSSGGLSSANFADNETPSGTINGSNTVFTLSASPSPSASLQLFYNGQILDVGAGNDFTISGSSVTMLFAPATGSKLRAWFRK
jgi:hypothetical protein